MRSKIFWIIFIIVVVFLFFIFPLFKNEVVEKEEIWVIGPKIVPCSGPVGMKDCILVDTPEYNQTYESAKSIEGFTHREGYIQTIKVKRITNKWWAQGYADAPKYSYVLVKVISKEKVSE